MDATPTSTPPPLSESIDRASLLFILTTAFLNLAGIGLVGPVTPFLAGQYVPEDDLALVTGLLFTAYSFMQFLALPGLGALSDRFGRRPILLISLLGSAIGYLIFGIGGALWVLFLGRIIDGVTGANLGTIYAYVADLTRPEQRTRYYGLIGAVSGLGFVVGPALGAILSRIGGVDAPAYFAAVVTLLNVVWGYLAMPESLPPDKRIARVRVGQLNPLTQLVAVLRLPQLRWLFAATFVYTLPFAALQSNLSVLGKDVLGATADQVSIVFALVGVVGIIVQGGVLRLLTRRIADHWIALIGAGAMAVGYAVLALIPLTVSYTALYIGAIAFAFGNSLFLPSLTGMTSRGVSPREQGQVQGGSQSVQALARVIGPLVAGAIYGTIGRASPYYTGAVLAVLAGAMVIAALPDIRAARS